jgi:hypothetical protein
MEHDKVIININPNVNFAESFIGNVTLFGKAVIVPVCNLHIIEGNVPGILKDNEGKFLDYGYALFEDVKRIDLNYTEYSIEKTDLKICIGGINYNDMQDYEYWVLYKRFTLLLQEGCLFSNSSLSFQQMNFAYFNNRDLINIIKNSI